MRANVRTRTAVHADQFSRDYARFGRSCHRSSAEAADTSVCFASFPFTWSIPNPRSAKALSIAFVIVEGIMCAWPDFVTITAQIF